MMVQRQSWKKHFVEAGGYRTCYLDEGKGEVVLLLHSVDPGCSGALEFRHNIAPLSSRFRVIVPDLIGFGDTDPPDRQIPGLSAAYTNHILALMDALDISRAHLVGNSRGGLISIAIADLRPERVGRIILLGNAGGGVSKEYMEKQAALYAGFSPSPESLRHFLSGSYFSLERDVPPDVFDAYLANAQRQYAAYDKIGGLPSDVPDFRPALAKIAVPVLYIFGKEDERWPPLPDALETFIATPGARFYVISSCGHHPQTEFPEDFNAIAPAFLSGTLR